MNKKIYWVAVMLVIFVPAYFIAGIGDSPQALDAEGMLPYEIEIINDDSALDPANVDIYTAFNSVLETKVVN